MANVFVATANKQLQLDLERMSHKRHVGFQVVLRTRIPHRDDEQVFEIITDDVKGLASLLSFVPNLGIAPIRVIPGRPEQGKAAKRAPR